MTVRHGWGIALASALCMGLAGCYASRTDRADTNTNWVKCNTDSECSDGQTCQAGICRMEMPAAGTGGRGDAGTRSAAAAGMDGSGSIMKPFGDASTASPPSMPAPTETTFGTAGSIVFSSGVRASVPYVRFVRGHFEVFYRTGASSPTSSTFELLHVTPAGVTDRFTSTPKDYWFDLIVAFADDGRIAVAHGCLIEVLQPDLQGDSVWFDIDPCSDDEYMTVASIPGSEDWLMAFSDPAMARGVLLGRYRPSLDGFAGPTISLGEWGEFPREQLLVLDGPDALYAVGNAEGAAVVRTPGWGMTEFAGLQDGMPIPLLLEGTIGVGGRDGGFAFAQVGGETLVFGSDGSSLWTSTLDPDSQPATLRELSATPSATFGPAAVAAPELGAAGVCYDSGNGLSFMLVDADRRPSMNQRLFTGGPVLRCDIAWSGTAFLVVFTERETGSDTVHGQLVTPM